LAITRITAVASYGFWCTTGTDFAHTNFAGAGSISTVGIAVVLSALAQCCHLFT